MPLDDLLGEVAEGVVEEAVQKPISKLMLWPFRLVGAIIVFLLDGGKRSITVAYRLPGVGYYGLAVAFIVLVTYLFFWVA